MEEPKPNLSSVGKPALIFAGITVAAIGALIVTGGG